MIRITKRTDYGFVLLSTLALSSEGRFSAPELAGASALPLPMVSKILKELARAGILISHRGVHGGYALARAPQEVTVHEVITALEGPIAVTECIDDSPGECDKQGTCPVSSNWGRINRAIREALEGITLAQMSLPTRGLITLGGRAPVVAVSPAEVS